MNNNDWFFFNAVLAFFAGIFFICFQYKLCVLSPKDWFIGAVYKKDDGSMFLMLDAFFNFAALPRKEGSDRVSIALFNPKSNSDNQTDNDSGVPF